VPVLVAYASKHGATAEIADALAEELTRRGVQAEAKAADDVKSLDGYDAVVLGSAVYMGQWLKAARELAESHPEALGGMPVWLFSSGPLGPPEELKPEGDPVDVADLTKKTGAVEHRVFAGKLDKKKLGFGERAMVRAVHAPEGDFRDWQAISGFAAEIAEHVNGNPSATDAA
jgi:menaquinone-dependent protoporphyrinogen oxidase